MSNVEVKLDRGVFHCEIVIHPDSDRVRVVNVDIPVNHILGPYCDNPFEAAGGKFKPLIKNVMLHVACTNNDVHVDDFQDAKVSIRFKDKKVTVTCDEVEYDPHFYLSGMVKETVTEEV